MPPPSFFFVGVLYLNISFSPVTLSLWVILSTDLCLHFSWLSNLPPLSWVTSLPVVQYFLLDLLLLSLRKHVKKTELCIFLPNSLPFLYYHWQLFYTICLSSLKSWNYLQLLHIYVHIGSAPNTMGYRQPHHLVGYAFVLTGKRDHYPKCISLP